MMLRRLKEVLWALAFAAAVALFIRFTRGLGAATSLDDSMPWGVWKILNMVAGVALSTGGFAFAAAVHVFHIRRLEPLLRPALLIAALGYGSSCAALFIDIGLPYRIWHPLVHWNAHSFLFEVAWCVMIYLSVTVLEFTPIALEGSKHQRILKVLRMISPPLVILGITLSTLHHTTLGSLFLVSPSRLHPLWWSPGLPIHFYLSALGAGIMSVILVILVVGRLYKQEVPRAALVLASRAAAVVLSLYLATRVLDIVRRDLVSVIASGQWESFFYLAELTLGVAVPILIVAVPRLGRRTGWLALAASFAVFGLLLNRLDVGIIGYFRSAGRVYLPTAAELAIAFGIPAVAGLVFFAFLERFKVFTPGTEPVRLTRSRTAGLIERRIPAFLRLPGPVMRVSLVCVVSVSLALGLFTAAAGEGDAAADPVARPLHSAQSADILIIDGDRDGDSVRYPHELHAGMLGGEDSCRMCHHLNATDDVPDSCTRCHGRMHDHQPLFDHDRHILMVGMREGGPEALAKNRSCARCHDADRPRPEVDPDVCIRCHGEPGWAEVEGVEEMRGYVHALHDICRRCHGERVEGSHLRKLGNCSFCHE